jgi:hypothetical protein
VTLARVLEERHQYQETGGVTLGLQPGECIVSVGDRKRQPVQKWNGNLVWPGRLTLTDRALYFEVCPSFLWLLPCHEMKILRSNLCLVSENVWMAIITYYHLLITCDQCVQNKRCKCAILELVTKINI